MSPPEMRVVQLLADAAIAFNQLDTYHPADKGEFADAIHRAQNLVMGRQAVRQHPDIFHREPLPDD